MMFLTRCTKEKGTTQSNQPQMKHHRMLSAIESQTMSADPGILQAAIFHIQRSWLTAQRVCAAWTSRSCKWLTLNMTSICCCL